MIHAVDKAFWFVWNPEGRNPQCKHLDELSATMEAERLARENPGQTFVILQAIGVRRVDSMIRIALVPEDTDIPF